MNTEQRKRLAQARMKISKMSCELVSVEISEEELVYILSREITSWLSYRFTDDAPTSLGGK